MTKQCRISPDHINSRMVKNVIIRNVKFCNDSECKISETVQNVKKSGMVENVKIIEWSNM